MPSSAQLPRALQETVRSPAQSRIDGTARNRPPHVFLLTAYLWCELPYRGDGSTK